MLCIVRLHQGKAVRKHGRPLQTPFYGHSCDLVWRPFVGVSINSTNRGQGCRTWLLFWLWKLSTSTSIFRLICLRSTRIVNVAMAVGWDKRSEGPPNATIQMVCRHSRCSLVTPYGYCEKKWKRMNNTEGHNMAYRCEAQSPEAVVQLIAASYLRHGFYWYVTGSIPAGKDPTLIDRKLITKYGIDVSEWQRRQRKQRGVANAHYLRYQQWFILLVSEGHHALKQPTGKGGEGEHLCDCRRSRSDFMVIRFRIAERESLRLAHRQQSGTPTSASTTTRTAYSKTASSTWQLTALPTPSAKNLAASRSLATPQSVVSC